MQGYTFSFPTIWRRSLGNNCSGILECSLGRINFLRLQVIHISSGTITFPLCTLSPKIYHFIARNVACVNSALACCQTNEISIKG